MKNAWLFIPYGWMLFFLIFPFLIILGISLAEIHIGVPPYSPLLSWNPEGILQIRLFFSNYFLILFDGLYRTAYFNSLAISFFSTLFCLFLGYPIAYGITLAPKNRQIFLLVLATLPFWISSLIRIYAWINLLSPNGIINHFLLSFGVISRPLELMHTPFATVIGIVYTYLSFMILPLYLSIEKIDSTLLESAYDLGCRPIGAFWKIIFPLSLPGVFGGASLVFIPTVGEYVIPELLGGPTSLTIGRVLWTEFFFNRDWPVACALAIIMMILLLIPIIAFEKLQTTIEKIVSSK